ncbi:MAG: trimeric intracellular cation channel family protein [Bacteroidales bacterium]|nr:trimeric intracellular cation channel family protein [Bacteroidales bacterium]
MELIYGLDLFGTMMFAVSGTLAGVHKRLDMFGALFTGFITAVGGGTIRDLLLGSFPIGWINDPNYLLMILAGYIFTFLFNRKIEGLRRTFFLFDTFGIGVFTIIGLQKALDLGVNPMVAVLMGTVSAVFGGALRDTFINDIPLIFRKEIYAVACLAGGIIFLLLQLLPIHQNINQMLTVSVIVAIRFLSVKYKLGLPIHGVKNMNMPEKE